jgi:hypothetical protein
MILGMALSQKLQRYKDGSAGVDKNPLMTAPVCRGAAHRRRQGTAVTMACDSV